MVNIEEVFSRQSSMFDSIALLTRRCVFLGCGFVGSNLAYNIMKTGFKNFLLVDFDVIEEGNLLNQMYTKKNLGMKKTQALMNRLFSDSPIDIIVECKERIEDVLNTDEIIDGDIVFVSSDNVQSKRMVIEYFLKKVKAGELTNCVLCILGTGSDNLSVFIQRNSISKLEKLLQLFSKSDEYYTTGICGLKSAYFIGSLLSGLTIFELRNNYLKSYEEKESGYVILTNPLQVLDENDVIFD